MGVLSTNCGGSTWWWTSMRAVTLTANAGHRAAAVAGRPAGDHHLALGEEPDRVTPLPVQGAEEGLLGPREREVGHRRGHADVDADVAGLDAVAELASRRATRGEDRGRVAVVARVDAFDRLVQAADRRHTHHGPEDLLG